LNISTSGPWFKWESTEDVDRAVDERTSIREGVFRRTIASEKNFDLIEVFSYAIDKLSGLGVGDLVEINAVLSSHFLYEWKSTTDVLSARNVVKHRKMSLEKNVIKRTIYLNSGDLLRLLSILYYAKCEIPELGTELERKIDVILEKVSLKIQEESTDAQIVLEYNEKNLTVMSFLGSQITRTTLDGDEKKNMKLAILLFNSQFPDGGETLQCYCPEIVRQSMKCAFAIGGIKSVWCQRFMQHVNKTLSKKELSLQQILGQ
jgi:hypothetical protein